MYTQEDADSDYKLFFDSIEAIKKKAERLVPFHEDSVTFLRLDTKKIESTLFTDSESAAKKDNIRLSWYGMVLQTCPYEHSDPYMEEKKKRLTPGMVFMFNPEVAYSLNVPSMYEIWTLAIHNIMNIDLDYDPLVIYRKSLQARVDMFKARLKSV